MRLKDFFDQSAITEGKELYNDKRVRSLRGEGSIWSATVRDANFVHSVDVMLDAEEEPLQMACTCAEAKAGIYCRHMAAVCMAVQRELIRNKGVTSFVKKKEYMVSAPFEKQKAQAGYYYYDLNYITRKVKITNTLCEKAKDLLRQEAVTLVEAESGFVRGICETYADLHVLGIYQEGRTQWNLSLDINRETFLSSSCPGIGCSNYYTGYYYSTDGKICEHVLALLFLLEDYILKYNPGDATDQAALHMFDRYRRQRVNQAVADTGEHQMMLQIEPKLEYSPAGLAVSFRTGVDKLYVIKDLTEFVRQMENGETVGYGKKTVIPLAQCRMDEHSQAWYDFLKAAVMDRQDKQKRMEMKSRYYGDVNLEVKGNVELSGVRLDEFYQMVKDREFEFVDRRIGQTTKRMMTCKEGIIKPDITITKHIDERGIFQGIQVAGVLPVTQEGAEAYYALPEGQQCLLRMDKEAIRGIRPLYDMADEQGVIRFRVGRKNLSEFYYSILPILKKYCIVAEKDAKDVDQYLPEEAVFRFYLDVDGEDITCLGQAVYGEQICLLTDICEMNDDMLQSGDLMRDFHKEEEAAFHIRRYFPEIDSQKNLFHCGRDEEAVYELLNRGVEELMEIGEVHSTEKFKRLTIRRSPKITVGVSVNSDLMNLSVQSDDLTPEELVEILSQYRHRKKFFRLKNGDFVNMEEESLELLGKMMDAMNVSPREFVRGKMQVPAYRALYLDRMLEENSGIYSKRDSHFRRLVKEFKTVNDSDFEVPAALADVMRNYQVTGYKWLRTLAAYGFGGILADDMGLGKTLQVISVVLADKLEQQKQALSTPAGADSQGQKLPGSMGIIAEAASVDNATHAERSAENTENVANDVNTGNALPWLVVCPASLVYNWEEEITRFAPELATAIVVGSQKEREALIHDYRDYDILVTSYDLLKRDIDHYEDCTFRGQVLDEAQFIKNHTTAAAKAVKLIHSQIHYALTGTPIENRLSELWSIFDFLMPGFLYGYETFRREIETPVVKYKDRDASERLRRMVSPFILRRLKKDVLKDLPDKLEKVYYAKLEDKQQQLYDGQVTHMQQMLRAQNEADYNKDKLKILAELTRIRQICCDPSLIYSDYDGGSAKRESCMALIHQAMEGEHRILLFSQFTSMLALLEADLRKENIPYYKITGETPKKTRVELVNAFNEGDIPVFLISLKAGGTGLNLTGADVVIHYDPWWNLAVQNQATDRAHRIGQTNIVSVYRLIIRDSIEEKILKMQEDKKDLAEEILSGENGGLSSLSRDELLQLLQV